MLTQTINTLLPQYCLLCQVPATQPIPLCFECQKTLPWSSALFPLAGTQLPYPLQKNSIAAFHYAPPISNWISSLKFNEKLIHAKLLGYLVSCPLKNFHPLPDCIIPIPLHRKRLIKRGFNQTYIISRTLSKQLQIPLETRALKRIKNTTAQTELNLSQRKKNMENAFLGMKNLKDKRIALLDDVITTGNTIHAAYQALLSAGAKDIQIWCCAHPTKG